MNYFVLLAVLVFASKENKDVATNAEESTMENTVENPILVKIEEDEYAKKKRSNYIGVSYNEDRLKWRVSRWSKKDHKTVHNGYYKDEETAAHASDTLVRKLMAGGEKDHKINFPDDNTEVYQQQKTYIGVTYHDKGKGWVAQRWSKTEKILFYSGYYKNEETTAHASDTLARELMANGEFHKLNFPDDSTAVYPDKTKSSKYLGVSYIEKIRRWVAQRWSKTEKKLFVNGYHKDEENAAHASDTLAEKLMANGEQGHKLNFPDDNTELHSKNQKNKRKRHLDFENSQENKSTLQKFEEKEKRK